jgi:hypothetical protein
MFNQHANKRAIKNQIKAPQMPCCGLATVPVTIDMCVRAGLWNQRDGWLYCVRAAARVTLQAQTWLTVHHLPQAWCRRRALLVIHPAAGAATRPIFALLPLASVAVTAGFTAAVHTQICSCPSADAYYRRVEPPHTLQMPPSAAAKYPSAQETVTDAVGLALVLQIAWDIAS